MNENDKCSTDGLTIPRGRFPQDTPLAMAYVPMQTWEEPYDMEEGFCRGTIFPSLYYPFLAAGGEADNGRKG